MKAKSLVRALLIAGFSASLATACSGASDTHSKAPVAAAGSSHAEATFGSSTPPATSALPDFSSLVQKYGPAVVNVSVTEDMSSIEADHGSKNKNSEPNDPFWQFFRNLPLPKPPHQQVRGVGSGFIVSPDGVILTNAHVVDNAKQVTVKLIDRREFKAKVVGKDDQSDVAVLKIDASNLPSVKLGDSSQLKVGQWVVAIGSPYGFDNSVTAGIVSAKARSLGDSYVPFLQTDVPVNPGNSGGPLFNLKGQVVGINSQIYSRNGGFQGLSFAIPINVVAKVQDQLLTSGHVTRGRIGVAIQDVSQGLANSFGLKHPTGALISAVDPNGAAAKAGIRPGDVILKMNGQDVAQSSDLPVKIAEMKPGTKLTMEVWRDGQARDVTVMVGKFSNQSVASAAGPGGEHEGG